jgi:DNA (cytosine-5)-methyltransferase 1
MPDAVRYLSVCSGMEAASVAWHPLGWTPVAFSEIEPFPSAILKHRFSKPNYPYDVPNLGSLTEYQSWPLEPGAIDLLVGGTPCQSFSVAGLRKGLADPRGNLALTFLGLADKLKPRWIVWENVPGVLSSNGGRDFGSFVGALGQLGYGWAMRILDAQHFGVPQRRRRVFVVACLGDWRAAAEILSLAEGLSGYLAKGKQTRKGSSSDAKSSVGADGLIGGIDYEHNAHGPNDVTGPLLKGSPTGGGHPLPAIAFRKSKRACSTTDNETWVPADASKTLNNFDLGDTRTTHAVVQPVAIQGTIIGRGDNAGPQGTGATEGGPMFTLTKTDIHGVCQAQAYENHDQNSRVTGPLVGAMAVRRLTPVECERLQGFPDNWSRISWKGKPEEDCPDGPRYKACGNSMAVPVMRWIGERIAAVDSTISSNA